MAQMTAEEIARKRYLSDEKEAAEKQALIERKAKALDRLEQWGFFIDVHDNVCIKQPDVLIDAGGADSLLDLAEALPPAPPTSGKKESPDDN